MKFYGLKTCDTCRKAQKALSNTGLSIGVVDVRSDGIPTETLRQLFAAFNEELINKRSTTWRNLSETEKQADPLKLLADYPTLMKRPVIDDNGTLYLGWGKAVQDAVLK